MKCIIKRMMSKCDRYILLTEFVHIEKLFLIANLKKQRKLMNKNFRNCHFRVNVGSAMLDVTEINKSNFSNMQV